MRLNLTLDNEWLKFIAKYQAENQLQSKSEVIKLALELLKQQDLQDQYKLAYEEWRDSGEEAIWEAVVGDGLEPEDWK
jgi:hypothetical protein